MKGREQIGWSVPETVYSAHRDFAIGEGYKSHARAVEDAIRQFIDGDELAAIEHRLDDILAPLPSNEDAKKTTEDLPEGRTTSGEMWQMNLRIDSDLKAELARFACETLDVRPGVALRYALLEHQTRNRQQRIHDKLDVIEAAVGSTQATSFQQKVDAIVEQLGESFRLSEFTDAAKAVGITTEKYAIKKFLPAVLDRTETVPYNDPQVFIPKSAVDAPMNPNPANLPYYAMTDNEKIVGLQVAALRKAWSNGGRGRLTVAEGVDTLAGVGSPRQKTVRAAMREAEKDDGFEYDDREPALKVNTNALDTSTEAWIIAAEEKARETSTTPRGEARDGNTFPGVDADDTSLETSVSGEMDFLISATAVTGGEKDQNE